ncbi:MAG: TerB family tellurite resistance protein [Myxococcota bacterium]|jgi:uncharacterized tellurite resistance protein B-like protein|nr:TerB family tellurite resistance protein [bacterium]MDP6074159.1 TerB family tellurite resistance protein [Myxococcota bacterium]MDP6241770.1 TerB family tellurite resistance protein [Myxococcota bacterium]MDP7074594.1 TerB family tellurite resistance protein [Myxococcota bacterium]MDP7299434.1 TerB family tellurite resistance protein [Myxococcota bacterium]
MSLLKFLGLSGDVDASRDARGETDTVRRIVTQLERLPAEQAKHLATFAYVLARVAHADFEIDESEIHEMERIVRELAHLSESEAVLVVQIAKSQAQHLGGTENYIVTRTFRRNATREQRAQLLECLYAVAAADGTISGAESNEILNIAEELGFTRPEAIAVRAAFREHLSEFQKGPEKD